MSSAKKSLNGLSNIDINGEVFPILGRPKKHNKNYYSLRNPNALNLGEV